VIFPPPLPFTVAFVALLLPVCVVPYVCTALFEFVGSFFFFHLFYLHGTGTELHPAVLNRPRTTPQHVVTIFWVEDVTTTLPCLPVPPPLFLLLPFHSHTATCLPCSHYDWTATFTCGDPAARCANILPRFDYNLTIGHLLHYCLAFITYTDNFPATTVVTFHLFRVPWTFYHYNVYYRTCIAAADAVRSTVDRFTRYLQLHYGTFLDVCRF